MIFVYEKNGKLDKTFDTQAEVAEYLGTSRGNVSKVVNGMNKSIKGKIIIPDDSDFELYCVENKIPYINNFFVLYDAITGNIIAYFNGSPSVAKYLGINTREVHKLFNKNKEGKVLTILNNTLMKDFDILHYVNY